MSSAKVYLQVLGAETVDTTPSLLLFTDSQRYIFNCGEGTQRLFNEHKIKFSKTNNIFLTQICWEYIGGLPGLAMTLRDNGRSSLSLFGPENTSDFIKATRFFLHQEKLHFDCVDFSGSEEDKYEDENITIWPVVLTGESKDEFSLCHLTTSEDEKSEDSDFTAEEEDVLHIRKKRKHNLGAKVSLSYICQLADLPGKFLPQKAIELGVSKGPLFGELKQGKVITLDNGLQVKPEEVMEPNQPGPIFMIIDCPSVEHFQSLINNARLSMFQTRRQENTAITLMVHVTPKEVFNSSNYQDWLNSYGAEVQHLLFGRCTQYNDPVFQRQHRIQCKLHTINSKMFPLLYSSDTLDDEHKRISKNITVAENFTIFHLRPLKQQGFDYSDIPPRLNSLEIMSESYQLLCNMLGGWDFINAGKCTCLFCSKNINLESKTKEDMINFENIVLGSDVKEMRTSTIDNLETSCEEMEHESMCIIKDCNSGDKHVEMNASLYTSRDQCNLDKDISSACKIDTNDTALSDKNRFLTIAPQRTCLEPNSQDFNFQVVFIGTGASLPSKYRNVSATLVSIGNKSVLLDSGEGTYGQLYRHYGNQLDDVIQRLSCVFISHIHADHHLGLVRILIKRHILLKESGRFEEPLLVIGPQRISNWLHEYDNLCQCLAYSFVDCSTMTTQDHKWRERLELLLDAKEILAVPVDHCVEAYGLVWRHTSGYSVVYSGDTRPSNELVQAGAGATVLIHEATFEDELKAEALEKKHSTTTEAINVGKQMKAKLIMLNHFSQRYPKIPVFSEQFTDCIGVAFDHMRIHYKDFEEIPKLLEPLKVLFAEEMKDLSSKTR